MRYPIQFEFVSDFVSALNSYQDDNVWQDLIYGAEIKENRIDFDKSNLGDGCVIYLKSGRTILYRESLKIWQ